MPLIINEVVSDITIGSGPAAGGPRRHQDLAEAGPDLDRAREMLRHLAEVGRRLSGRDEDDPPGGVRP